MSPVGAMKADGVGLAVSTFAQGEMKQTVLSSQIHPPFLRRKSTGEDWECRPSSSK